MYLFEYAIFFHIEITFHWIHEMAKRVKLEKNVPSNTIQDIEWSLSCTDAYVKAVADTVKRLQTRTDFLEQDMSVVLRLTKEISSLKELVMNKKKEEKNTDIPYQPKKKQRKLVENESPKKKNKEKSFLLRE